MAGRRWGRSSAYLLGSLASGCATLLALPLLCHPALARPWARWHRDGALWLLGEPVVEGRPIATRRALLWLPLHVVTGVAAGLAALVCVGNALLAVVVTPLWWAFDPPSRPRLFIEVFVDDWATALTLGLPQLALLSLLVVAGFPVAAGAHARLSAAVLAPSPAERLADRVAELTRTRAEVLDAHGAELRRIERDLHDGTQARLVAIAMRLDLARRELPAGSPPLLDQLLREAHEGTEEAMGELRQVIRTIYPPILADRGLTGALTALTARCPVPARLASDELGRVPAAVEAIVYFAVAEALANVARHSRATSASVALRRSAGRLYVTIRDDGAGGADPARGSGLSGIRGRVAALDGSVSVDSPAGGPTTIALELPCG